MSTLTPPFDWPLAVDSFTFADKARIALWLLRGTRYTMGEKVAEFEAEMSKLASGRYALGVANGSAANQLVFELWKNKLRADELKNALVIVPAVTWISSITPATMAGLKIAFCDINVTDFAFDYDALEKMLKKRAGKPTVIWPTALIGFCPDMPRLQRMALRYGAELFLDSCENTLSYLAPEQSILASADVTTTSCYFSHQITAVEFGFVFFKHESDYALGKMLRNHGLTRSLPTNHLVRRAIELDNPKVDPAFLFALNGTNLRPTDVHAMFGLQDIKRVDRYRVNRCARYTQFREGLNGNYYLPPPSESHVGFCLPIFLKGRNGCNPVMGGIEMIKRELREAGIEVRPIIGGCLPGIQPPFKQYGPATKYPNALWVHEQGAYVGLHDQVTEEMVDGLVDLLNGL